jgi:hypothetical protein
VGVGNNSCLQDQGFCSCGLYVVSTQLSCPQSTYGYVRGLRLVQAVDQLLWLENERYDQISTIQERCNGLRAVSRHIVIFRGPAAHKGRHHGFIRSPFCSLHNCRACDVYRAAIP